MKGALITLSMVPALMMSGNATLTYVKKVNATCQVQAATVSYQLDTRDFRPPSVEKLVAMGYLDKAAGHAILTALAS